MRSSETPGGQGCDTYSFDSLSSMVGAVTHFVETLPPRERIRACHMATSCLEAIETVAAVEFIADDGDTRAAERALSDRKSSKHAARRTAKRAAAAAKNPTIAEKMKSRELSGEQVDAVVRADARTGGAASGDASLLDELSDATADETKAIVDKFIVDQANADTAQKEHDRQRGLRDVRKHRTGTGLAAITLAGDDASIDAMHKQLLADAAGLYRGDGGREVPNSQHPRTNGHRLFDAAKGRITGAVDAALQPDGDGEASSGVGTNSGGSRVDGAADGRPSAGDVTKIASKRYTPPAARRPTIVVLVDIDKLTGVNPSLVAHQIGLGPIADSVLAAYLGDSRVGVDLVGAVFGKAGHPLWLGRTVRYASDAQYLALVIRDKGCVDCGASADRCQVHHCIPWNSPAKGETNIDDLALLCGDCHHRLHEQKQTLYRRHTSGRWAKRAATPDEIAPPRPTTQARAPDRRAGPRGSGSRNESDVPAERGHAA